MNRVSVVIIKHNFWPHYSYVYMVWLGDAKH